MRCSILAKRLNLHTVQKRRFLVIVVQSPFLTHHARNDNIDIAFTLCYTRFATTKQSCITLTQDTIILNGVDLFRRTAPSILIPMCRTDLICMHIVIMIL